MRKFIAVLILAAACFVRAESSFANKTFVILGDSSTTKVKSWANIIKERYLPESCTVINTAVGGSAWEYHGKRKYKPVLPQWEDAKKLLAAQKKSADIIIITTGGNCFPDSKYSYKDVLDFCDKTDLKGVEEQMRGAITALKKITEEVPAAEIYLVANFYAGANPAKDRRRLIYRDQLAALCDYYACRLIDLTRNSCIRGRLEIEKNKRIFTTDRVHAYTEAGKERIARLIFAAVKQDFPTPEK